MARKAFVSACRDAGISVLPHDAGGGGARIIAVGGVARAIFEIGERDEIYPP